MRSFDKQPSRDKRIAHMLFKSAVNKANKPPLRDAVPLRTFDAAGVLSHHFTSLVVVSSGQMRCQSSGKNRFLDTPATRSTIGAYAIGGRPRERQPLMWFFVSFSASTNAARLVSPPALSIASCMGDFFAMPEVYVAYPSCVNAACTCFLH